MAATDVISSPKWPAAFPGITTQDPRRRRTKSLERRNHVAATPGLGDPYDLFFIAFQSRGGLIGSSCMRTPAARAIAFAIAAGGATIGVSPTPRTP